MIKLCWHRGVFGAVFLSMAACNALAVSAVTVGQDDGYSGRVMDKIVAKWTPPPQLMGNHKLKLVISVDQDGHVLECSSSSPSGLEALDVSACAAAHAAAPFGSPPYGMPARLYFSFWTGGPSPRLKPDAVHEADTSDADMRVARSRAASIRAQAMAGEAARSSGRKLPQNSIQANSGQAKKLSSAETKQHKQTARTEQTGRSANATGKANVAPAPDSVADAGAQGPQIDPGRLERYISTITWNLRNAMYVPIEAAPGIYHATVRLHCNRSGKILSSSIIRGSGDEHIDRYVRQGIKRAGSIVPPPSGAGDTFDLTFTLERK